MPSRENADSLSLFSDFCLDERFVCLRFLKRQSKVAYVAIHCGFMGYILFSATIQTVTFFPFCDFSLSCDSRKHFDSLPPGPTPPQLAADCSEK